MLFSINWIFHRINQAMISLRLRVNKCHWTLKNVFKILNTISYNCEVYWIKETAGKGYTWNTRYLHPSELQLALSSQIMKWFLPFQTSLQFRPQNFTQSLPLHLKSLGFLQSIAIITLYSHCNLSEKKQSTEQKKQLSQTRDCLQNRQSKRHIYLSWLFKNYSQVKHTFWQLWSLWYVSVHWNAGTESQTGLHHVLLEEWEHCAKYRRKINERESRDFTV